MATFVSQRTAPLRYRWKALAAAVGLGIAALAPAAPAGAATNGFTNITGGGVLNLLGFPFPINYDAAGAPSGTPPTVDFNGTSYNLLFNEYIAFVQGNSGTFSQTVPSGSSTVTNTYSVAGRISIGNVAGSLRMTADDQRGLMGPSNVRGTGQFARYERQQLLFPLASDYTEGGVTNATSYMALTIDPGSTTPAAATQVLGANTTQAITPQFRTRANELVTAYNFANNIQVEQVVRLRRSTVMIEWRIRNVDATAAHNVGLQYAISLSQLSYFEDPNRGRTTEPTEFLGGNVPESFTFPNTRVAPPFFPRLRLRRFGATPPDRVRVQAFAAYTGIAYVDPTPALLNQFPDIIGGGNIRPGVILYWNPVTIPAGSTRTIVIYYGNAAASESFASDETSTGSDYVVGTEAAESLVYNTNGNALLTDAQKIAATPQVGAAFLTPNPLTVYGSTYNQVPSAPETAIPLVNVTMTLGLPTGLTLGTDPTTGATDVAPKTVAFIPADTDGGPLTWTVAPTGEAYGALTYQLSVAVGSPPLPGRTVSRLINVPAMPVRTFSNADWNLISFPFAFDPTITNNSDVNVILNGITATPDQPATGIPIFRWVPDALSPSGEGSYQQVTQVGPGVAYFYRPTVSRTVFLNGAVPVANQTPPTNPATGLAPAGTPQQVLLERGWNMIGNPYVYDIPLTYIRIVPLDNNPSLRSFTFREAIDAGYVSGAVFFYTGPSNLRTSPYDLLPDLSSPLSPWIGYWLFANVRCTVIYATPTAVNTAVLGTTPTSLTGRSAVRGAVAAGRMAIKNQTLDNWKVQLRALREDGIQDGTAFIGVNARAKNGADVQDLPKPPPFHDYVYLGIDGPTENTRYAQDIKAAGGEDKSWEFEVVTDKDSPVTLSWPGAPTLPRRLRLKLTDLESGRSINLRSASSYRVEALAAGVPRRFRVTATRGSSRAFAISNLRVVSVAGRAAGTSGRSASRSVRIEYSLTGDDVDVQGRILTMTGTLVRTLTAGRAASTGRNVLPWDGTGNDGGPLPAGPYQVEITARNAEGETITERRMFLSLQ